MTLYQPTRGSTFILPGDGPAGSLLMPVNDIDNQIYRTPGLELMFDGLSIVTPYFLAVDRRADLRITPVATDLFPTLTYDADAPGYTDYKFPDDATPVPIQAAEYLLPPSFTVISVVTPLDSSITQPRSIARHTNNLGDRMVFWMTQASLGADLSLNTRNGGSGSAISTAAVVPPDEKVVVWATMNVAGRVTAIGFNDSAATSGTNPVQHKAEAGFAFGGVTSAQGWCGGFSATYVLNRALYAASGADPLNTERDALLELIGSRHGVSW